MLNQKLRKLPCDHLLHQLDPLLQDGIMRVGGRLRNVPMGLELRHPITLLKDGTITNLVFACHHDKIQHKGKGITKNELRTKWIADGIRAVAQYIKHNVQCKRARAPPVEQRMVDLPSDHAAPTTLFTYCSMDCIGPFNTKQI